MLLPHRKSSSTASLTNLLVFYSLPASQHEHERYSSGNATQQRKRCVAFLLGCNPPSHTILSTQQRPRRASLVYTKWAKPISLSIGNVTARKFGRYKSRKVGRGALAGFLDTSEGVRTPFLVYAMIIVSHALCGVCVGHYGLPDTIGLSSHLHGAVVTDGEAHALTLG